MRRTTLCVLGLLPVVGASACAESAVLDTDIGGASASDGGATVDLDAASPGADAGSWDAALPVDTAVAFDAMPAFDATPPTLVAPDGGRTYATDRVTFFGEPRCERERLVLCEDFESEVAGQPADPAVWQTMGPRLVVDGTRAARGTHSLHVTTGSSETLHFVRTTHVAPAVRTRMWGRLFLWIEAPRPAMFSHWTVIEATGTHPAGGTARVRFGGIHIPNVENRLGFDYDIWGQRPEGFHPVSREVAGKDTAHGVWHCLEWMMDAGQREARLFRDGVEESGLTVRESLDGVALDFPSFDGLNIGMATYQSLGADSWSVWIDEIAVDTQRIGCST